MLNKIKELEVIAKRVCDISTSDDDIISQDNLFALQIEINDLYRKIKKLRERLEKEEN